MEPLLPDEVPRDEQERDTKELLRHVDLGIECEAVLGRELTQKLVLAAKEEEERLLRKLATLNPYVEEDKAEIIRTQVRLGGIGYWQEWIAEWVLRGRQAAQTLIEREEG